MSIRRKQTVFVTVFIFFCLATSGLSQLCNGNLSESVVEEDFGSGSSSIGSRLPTGQTNYNYVTGNLQDGDYTVARNANNGRPEWHNTLDKSDGNDGYMLLVNASNAPGEFYRQRITGLCENTQFEFSTWVQNVVPNTICGNGGIQPNLRFEIRTPAGDLLSFSESGNIAATSAPQWRQFGITFSTTTITEIDVIIINNAPGGCGNDLALDDISFKACGDVATITSNLSFDAICSNDVPASIAFEIELGGGVYANPVFQWQSLSDGNSWVNIAGEKQRTIEISPVLEGQSYRYLVASSETNLQNASCSVVSEVVEIEFAPVANFSIIGPDDLCEGESLQYTIQGNNTVQSVTWDTPTGIENQNSITVSTITAANAGNYTANIVDEFGCSYTVSKTLEVGLSTRATQNFEGCIGEEIILPDGIDYQINSSENLTFTLSNAENCDSIVTVTIKAFPSYNQVVDTLVCSGSQIMNPQGNLETITTKTSFNYQFLTTEGCDSIITKNITVPQPVLVNETTCVGEQVTLPNGELLTAQADFSREFIFQSNVHSCDSIVNYQLQVNPTFSENLEVIACPLQPFELPNGQQITENGLYAIALQTVNGCDSLVNYSVQFNLNECDYELLCEIRFPTGFSPNADGMNDSFQPLLPTGCGIENYELAIYNRWGEKVFTSTDHSESWLGPDQQLANSFLWSISYTLITPDGEEISKKNNGLVQVIY